MRLILLIICVCISYSFADRTPWSDDLEHTLAIGLENTASNDLPPLRYMPTTNSYFWDTDVKWSDMKDFVKLVSSSYTNSMTLEEADFTNIVLDAIDPLKSRAYKNIHKNGVSHNKLNTGNESTSIINLISDTLLGGTNLLLSRLPFSKKWSKRNTTTPSNPIFECSIDSFNKLSVGWWVSWFQAKDTADTNSVYIVAVSPRKTQQTSMKETTIAFSKEIKEWIMDQAHKESSASWCSKNQPDQEWQADFRFLKWNDMYFFQQNIWDIPCESV
ncbi:uncharacterized protein DI49_3960 [Saccharomyces eubayanus]|uniref:uncharacterized protein n=1 Tax=Saccharomyces eubayanus TaxID=1080349 RepID=UPI0006C36406|nr:hypothetical protein DI49_3960 [Saccharomyces eubayanus]KOG97223.1 hypothetical protein DI49_3960 [Saccharomyces eubayanus]